MGLEIVDGNVIFPGNNQDLINKLKKKSYLTIWKVRCFIFDIPFKEKECKDFFNADPSGALFHVFKDRHSFFMFLSEMEEFSDKKKDIIDQILDGTII